MNFWRIATKIFAFFSLIFLNFLSVNAQPESVYQLPAGTRIQVQMDNEINSRISGVNDTFTAAIAKPVVIRETVVLPTGTIVEGRITKVKRAGAGGRNGDLIVLFETMRLESGASREISGILVNNLRAKTSQTANLLTVFGGAALGGVFGAITKIDNGALIGAGIGAAAGTSVAFLKKGKEVGIKANEKFEIELTKNVTLPVQGY